MTEVVLRWRYQPGTAVVSAPLDTLGEFCPPAHRVLIVTTVGAVRRGLVQHVKTALVGREIHVLDRITPNPDLDMLDAELVRWRPLGMELLVGLGGGSALDAAKVLAACLPLEPGATLHRQFRDGHMAQFSQALPVIAVPTTAGTGAEVTPFATVWDTAGKAKYSLSGPAVAPRTTLLDPTLTLSLPKGETLHTGLDALSHALESLWNKHRTPVSEALALRALALIVNSLPNALADGRDTAARAQMQQASLLAGMAISTTRTAICHALSYPFTSHFAVPHGLACSFTLPLVLRLNLGILPAAAHMRGLYSEVLALLERLDLAPRVRAFVDMSHLDDFLRRQTLNVDRAGNYAGVELPVPSELVRRSLS